MLVFKKTLLNLKYTASFTLKLMSPSDELLLFFVI